MSEQRSERMQRVADVAGYHTEQAAQLVGRRRREVDAAETQLRELEQFRRDYAQGLATAGTSATCAADLLNRQRFVARIDAAIAQQHAQVQEKQRQLAAARAGWIQSRGRSSALDTVTERYRSREQARAERAEQAAADERAQRPSRPWSDPAAAE
ncbi:MAG TPA: flagellar export protein FliJ [Rhodanobacteraceae bacterium]|nr:flagellar export protein FliJ [Rhodanobacteraceae bacterium]